MNSEEQSLGEQIKATVVAIHLFQARHPSIVTQPESLRRSAESIQAYPISSKRHLQAMRSELDSTIRELRREVALGYWPRRTYDLLVAHLRDEGLIDISTWTDVDAGRMKKVLEKGAIRTPAELRLAIEYRDTLDEEQRRPIDALIDSYEAGRVARSKKASSPRSGSRAAGAGSKLSIDDLALVDLLRRSAVASYEYAASRSEASANDKEILEERAETWRTTETATPRDLKDMEEGFWVSMSNLRKRLTEEQFQELTRMLQEQGLMDISELLKAPKSQSRRAR
jgi:hypothetical protein